MSAANAIRYHIVVRVLREYLRPQYKLLLLTIAANLFVAGSTALLPWLVNLSIDGIFERSQKHLLYLLPLAVLGAMMMKSLSTYVARMSAGNINLRMSAQLERELSGNLIRSDLARITAAHSGQFLSRFMNDIPVLCQSMSLSLLNITQHLLT
ncbi:MAG: ABC transporter transmembrane domain-containing protein, partial [Hyphomicrobiales bacterium]|nr:ABC transporter transmembrane domain-containing protein [Hyphomicrobiales bacterium]